MLTDTETVASSSYMADYGQKLIDGGFRPIPIEPRKKWPARVDNRGGWINLGWEQYKTIPITPSHIRMWGSWSECGIGIICGDVVAVDIDLNDEAQCDLAYGIFNRMLGPTPAVRIGRAPRRLLVYRTETPFKKVSAGPIEVLADGQQFVAYGIHPEGHEYRWVGDRLHELTMAELPLVDEHMIRLAVQAVLEALPEEATKGARVAQGALDLPPGATEHQSSSYGLLGTREAIVSALDFFPNEDLPYDDWRDVGFAIYNGLGATGEGFELFDKWSQKSTTKYNSTSETVKIRWAAMLKSPPTIIGAGTLYKMAFDAGWKPDGIDLHPQPDLSHVDISGFLTPAVQPASSILPLRSGDELLQREHRPREWVIYGWIPDCQVTVLSGEGGTGKSLLALQLAIAAVTGGEWLGYSVRQRQVLYVAAEDDEDEIGRRLRDIYPRQRDGDLRGLRIAPMAGLDATLARFAKGKELTLTPVQRALEDVCVKFSPGLLVLDTSADLFGGEENDRQQVRSFMTMLRGLALRFRMAVLLLSHPSVSAMMSGRATSGSTAWANSARAVLLLEHDTLNENGRVYVNDADRRKLSLHKSNYSGKGASKMLRFGLGGFELDDDAPATANLAGADEKFLELFDLLTDQGHELSPAPTSPSYAPMMFESHELAGGFKKAAFKKAMGRLLANNRLVFEQHGPPSKPRRLLARTKPAVADVRAGSEQTSG
jgi:RecA-family ATPase